MRAAETERERRAKDKSPADEDPTAEEYAEFLRTNSGKYIVLAVGVPNASALDDPKEVKRMERDCVLTVGKKKYPLTGHFPPTAADPWLRLVFPRAVTAADRTLRFDLYLPSVGEPYRFAEFRVEELKYRGRLEM